MELEVINKLLNHWKQCNVYVPSKDFFLLDYRLSLKGIVIPPDLKDLYQFANGTSNWDNIAFVFYGSEELITMGSKFSLDKTDPLYDIVIFADYMDESWWYGIFGDGNSYNIGIIPTAEKFKVIANSLTEFINLYLSESDKLSDYL
jgi:hypothetical protein